MEWKGRRSSSNVEDQRGTTARTFVGGGIGTIIILVLYLLLGGDPAEITDSLQPGSTTNSQATYQETAQEKELAQFVGVVLADTEDIWKELFRANGLNYVYPKLVLFSGSVESACGVAGSSTGPFYCPADQKVYIDLSFYQDLQDRFKAPGDFAMAYVIAHEVGHHVQKQLGISDRLMAMKPRLSEKEYNQYMVRLELQADYFAGVWAHYAQRMNVLEEGDLEEALNAANAVGDDRIQKNIRGYVIPDSFTHGTSEQRQRWFYKGFQSGSMTGGDTFNAKAL